MTEETGRQHPRRALAILPALLFLLLPASAAAQSPSPEPGPALTPPLERVLIAPPNGYAPLPNANPSNGHFTAHAWGLTYGSKSTEAERLLGQYGFVDGFNFTWVSQATRHVMNEFVLAFQGGRGANQWFAYDKAADTSAPQYQHPDTLTGIPQYFGLHEAQSSVYGQAYMDGFVFVKGNDVIGVAYLSLSNDNLTLATIQTKNQFAAAPDFTIPSDEWPENVNPQPSTTPVSSGSSGGALPNVLPYALIIGAALVAIGLGATLLLMRVRRASSHAAGPAPVAQAAAPARQAAAPAVRAGAAASASRAMTLPMQMSVDGNYWYDGQRWVDVNQQAPPFAQRSPDGAFWWDGSNWRPVGLAQPPVSGR